MSYNVPAFTNPRGLRRRRSPGGTAT